MDNKTLINLISRLQNGDESAFNDIYDNFLKLVIHYANRLRGG